VRIFGSHTFVGGLVWVDIFMWRLMHQFV